LSSSLLVLLAIVVVAPAAGMNAPARDELIIATLDEPRLAREIFAETNRVRGRLGLPAFRADARLDGAAETQARIGHLQRPVSHTLPFPSIATPLDRVRAMGVAARLVSENLAVLSAFDAPHGAQFYRLRGETELRDSVTGRVLRRHTYASFAAAIVEAWMNSPGHRANIVDPRLEALGCAVQGLAGRDSTESVFAVQVFATPQGRRGR
jgi:uncharacterized protein YkwD